MFTTNINYQQCIFRGRVVYLDQLLGAHTLCTSTSYRVHSIPEFPFTVPVQIYVTQSLQKTLKWKCFGTNLENVGGAFAWSINTFPKILMRAWEQNTFKLLQSQEYFVLNISPIDTEFAISQIQSCIWHYLYLHSYQTCSPHTMINYSVDPLLDELQMDHLQRVFSWLRSSPEAYVLTHLCQPGNAFATMVFRVFSGAKPREINHI